MSRACGTKLILVRATLGALLIALVLDFTVSRSFEPIAAATLHGRSSIAIVFTGAYERIDAALDLLAADVVKEVFISGVNGNAGLSIQGFVAQFGPNHRNLQHYVDCCIAFGELADTTLQNALETQCWIQRRRITGPLVLVTSSAHMGRARAALANFLPDHELIAYPVSPPADISSEDDLEAAVREYAKSLVMQAAVHVPGARGLFPDLFGPWGKGCPGT